MLCYTQNEKRPFSAPTAYLHPAVAWLVAILTGACRVTRETICRLRQAGLPLPTGRKARAFALPVLEGAGPEPLPLCSPREGRGNAPANPKLPGFAEGAGP